MDRTFLQLHTDYTKHKCSGMDPCAWMGEGEGKHCFHAAKWFFFKNNEIQGRSEKVGVSDGTHNSTSAAFCWPHSVQLQPCQLWEWVDMILSLHSQQSDEESWWACCRSLGLALSFLH